MKKRALVPFALAAGLAASPASAAITVTVGLPVSVFADPSDVVIELDTAGSCGSKYFHIQRSNIIFKEFTAIALTAFANDKRMLLYIASCSGDRNILDHGAVLR
jgi:hypothetical protein